MPTVHCAHVLFASKADEHREQRWPRVAGEVVAVAVVVVVTVVPCVDNPATKGGPLCAFPLDAATFSRMPETPVLELTVCAAIPTFFASAAAGVPGQVLCSAPDARAAVAEAKVGSRSWEAQAGEDIACIGDAVCVVRAELGSGEVAHFPGIGVGGGVGSNEQPIRGCVAGVDPATEVLDCVLNVGGDTG